MLVRKMPDRTIGPPTEAFFVLGEEQMSSLIRSSLTVFQLSFGCFIGPILPR